MLAFRRHTPSFFGHCLRFFGAAFLNSTHTALHTSLYHLKFAVSSSHSSSPNKTHQTKTLKVEIQMLLERLSRWRAKHVFGYVYLLESSIFIFSV